MASKKKEDWYLDRDVVSLSKGDVNNLTLFRVRVFCNGKPVEDKAVENGYGSHPQDALDDFIRRNTTKTIERIAD